MALALVVMTTIAPPSAESQARLNQDQALRLAFPEPASIERRTAFLSPDQVAQVRELAGPGVEVSSGVVTYYVGTRGDTRLGVAYFDSHTVRTLSEVLMLVVGPDARIDRIEVLRFAEPPEYQAPEGWIDQLERRELTDALSLRGSIVNMTGATLTSQVMVAAARRVLALHRVIAP